MADSPTTHAFPNDDSLCEQCGYPIKGLSPDAVCPECGYAVADSSPARCTQHLDGPWLSLRTYRQMMGGLFLRPKQVFRSLSVNTDGLIAEQFLLRNSFLAALLLTLISLIGSQFRIESLGLIWLFVLAAIAMVTLTFVEMLGVTTFSQRRGWRVPFALAQRVCCFASVGWIPGSIIAATGYWLLEAFAAGQPWFEQNLGLVRVRWLFYALLFVLSFLWFETLVWIGVRQVRYANRWPNHP